MIRTTTRLFFAWRGAMLAAVALLSLAASANADTITFAPVVGANGEPYLGHTETGFTVTPLTGDWRNAQLFGNPTPDIFGGPIGSPLPASIEVKENVNALFNFVSVDLSGNNTDAAMNGTAGHFN